MIRHTQPSLADASPIRSANSPFDTAKSWPAVASGRSFTVRIVDNLGLWREMESELPEFDDRVVWQIAAGADATLDIVSDLSITLARDFAHLADGRPQRASVSILVDTSIPIGLRRCGPLVACKQGEIRDVVITLAQAIFRVVLADQVVSYDWSDIEEFLRADCLLTGHTLPTGSVEAFAAAAVGAVSCFQGRSRIEPDGLLLGIAAAELIPLVQRRNFTRPLLALAAITACSSPAFEHIKACRQQRRSC
jgi:hypothetical protein